MAGGTLAPVGSAPLHVDQYHAKLTWYVFVVALVAASGGLLFGYDIGITGGVEAMESFQRKFFPDVYEATENIVDTSPYCKYNSQELQLFTSSLFLAGLVIALPASYVTRAWGRKLTMLLAGVCFLIGAGLNAGAQNLAMLVVGRLFLGFGIGGANSSVPLYLSETAPFRWRGALNQMFQLATTIGILVAQLINYGVHDWDDGWRLSLGLAAVPAAILTLGGILLPESPNSLIERGHETKGRAVLEKLRGTQAVDAEFDDIKVAAAIANQIGLRESYKKLFTKKYSPMLIVTVCIASFQQLTGINAIMFYVPVLFNSLGSSRKTSLVQTIIVGAVNVLATFLAIGLVDKLGRRALFISGGILMIVAQVITGIVLGVEFGKYGQTLPDAVVIGVLITICAFIIGFAASWGPLGWLYPSEIHALETRPAAFSLAVLFNFLLSFVIGQAFLSMLCGMRWGTFIFFAAWVVIMTVFIYFLAPETKRVPVERVAYLFARHPVWAKFMGPKVANEILSTEKARSAAGAENGARLSGLIDGEGGGGTGGGVSAQRVQK